MERPVDKRIVYGLVAAAVIIAGAAAYFMFSGSSASLTGPADAVAMDVRPTDRVQGSPNAPITIIEYASMTCPHCARFQQEVMPKLIQNYIDKGKVKYIFRDFPLDGAARLASALALCVPKDKYYSFLDLLFLNQAKWLADSNHDNQVSADEVVEGLVQMGRFAAFSREKVESCISDPATLTAIDQTQEDAQARYGVNSTPTFILNGQVLTGEQKYEDFSKKLDQLLAHK